VKPAASIVVSGFGVREASWDRLRSCLEAIARLEGDAEVVLVANASLPGEVSADIRELLPSLKTIACDSSDPWARKTAGAKAATAPIIAFVDADCMPQTGWLASVLETFHYFPEVAAIRGREEHWFRRFLDTRHPGPVHTTASSNVAFRREAYLDCPFPEGSGARAVALQSAAMRRAHYVLWSEPGLHIIRDRRGLQPAGATQPGLSTAR
jgi:hypothetical protein